jgi:exodeoxyribonuclease VII large subunit
MRLNEASSHLPAHQKLSVLVTEIQSVLQSHFQQRAYWVVAEVSSHTFYPNQDRHYLELIEKTDTQLDPIAKIKTTVWKGGAARIRDFETETGQVFRDGLQVLVQVKVNFHIGYGLSLTIVDIDSSYTLGNVERQRQETIRLLMRENPDKVWKEGEQLVTFNQRLPISKVIQSIALIGSPNSEGYGDFMHTIRQNQYGYRFHIDTYQSSVQGAAAEAELVKTMVAIYESKHPYDLVVIIRGGGAKTDFLVFETYSVSRAIARFPIPVVTGIGHLGDQSIADKMAYTSMNAPTKVAEYIVAHNRRFEETIMQIRQQLVIELQQRLVDWQQELQQFKRVLTVDVHQHLFDAAKQMQQFQHLLLSRPQLISQQRSQELNFIQTQLTGYSLKLIQNQEVRLAHFQSIAQLMQVERMLARGFAIVYKNEQVVYRSQQLEPGDPLQIRLHEGTVEVAVRTTQK